jgi:tetratricopeptide (TPR) repeat protein
MSETRIKKVRPVDVSTRLQMRIQSIAASLHADPQAALMLCEQTFVEARDKQLHAIQLQAATHYGLIMDHLGRAADARNWLFEALQLAQTQNLPAHQAPLMELIARGYYTTGEYDHALPYWAGCLALCEHGGGDVRSWMLAKVGLGQIYDTLGDHASAVLLHRSANQRIHEVRDSYLDAKIKINLGVNLLRLDELDEAGQMFNAALALCRADFYHDYAAESLLGLSKIALARGDLDAAFTDLAAALAEADRVGYSWGQSQILGVLADARARQGDLVGAMAALRRGQEISRQGGINHTLSQQHFALAHYAEQQGDLRVALDEMKAGLVLERQIQEQLSPDRRRELEDKAGLHPSNTQRLVGLLSNPLVDGGPVADFFQLLARESCNAVGAARAGVWLLEAGGAALRGVCIFDTDEAGFVQEALLERALAPSLFAWLARGEALVAYDAAGHKDTEDLNRVYLAQRGVRSLLAFPIRLLDRVAGMLMVEHTGSQRNWTPDDAMSVRQIADAATRALSSRERMRFQQAISQLSGQLRLAHDGVAANIATLGRDVGDVLNVLSAYGQLDGWLASAAPDKLGALESIKQAAGLDQLERELAALLEECGAALSRIEEVAHELAGFSEGGATDLALADPRARVAQGGAGEALPLHPPVA